MANIKYTVKEKITVGTTVSQVVQQQFAARVSWKRVGESDAVVKDDGVTGGGTPVAHPAVRRMVRRMVAARPVRTTRQLREATSDGRGGRPTPIERIVRRNSPFLYI